MEEQSTVVEIITALGDLSIGALVIILIAAGVLWWIRYGRSERQGSLAAWNWQELNRFLTKILETQARTATQLQALTNALEETRDDLKQAITETRTAYVEITKELTRVLERMAARKVA